jgi:O-antigen/teichoic acid export membrane protein
VISSLRASLTRWLDPETRGLGRDSVLLGIGKAATTLGMMAQVALITHTLGLREYGVFALAVSFVALVDRFLDVDVGRAAITFAARYVRRDVRTTAGIYQFSYLVDLVLGVAGFLVVVAAAPFAGPALVGDRGFTLFVLYALTLLVSTVDGSSVSLLQLLDRYSLITWLTILRESARVAAVGIAVLFYDSLVAVVALLVVQDAVTAVAGLLLASRAFEKHANTKLFAPALSAARPLRRPMFGMIFQTNLIGYGRLAQSQLPALLLGILHGPLEVGIFKIGIAGATAIGQLSTPAWNAVMPRLARLWADRRLQAISHLLRQGSSIAFVVLSAAGLIAVVFRTPLLELFGGEDATAAGGVFVLGVAAQIVNGTVFWNDALLYAVGRAAAVTKVVLPSVAVLLLLTLILGHAWGAEGAATALFVSTVMTSAGLTLAAVRVLRQALDAAQAVAA